MAKTNAPKGLSISRNGNKFTFHWDRADKDYDNGQKLKWSKNIQNGGSIAEREITTVNIGKNATSKEVQIDPLNYYPYTQDIITSINFYVCGNRKSYKKNGKTINPTVSDWSSCTVNIQRPRPPKLTETLNDSVWNETTFSWELEASDTDLLPFTLVEYQSILVQDANGSPEMYAWNSSATGWQTGYSSNTTGSVTITENTSISTGSYTRFFRARSKGIGGTWGWNDIGWKYIKHVYAKPNQADVKETETSDTATGYNVKIDWEASATNARPIDATTVQYMIDVPLAGLTAPSGTWNSANVSADTKEIDVALINISQRLSADQCLWIKVDTTHDSRTEEGVPVLAKKGYLAAPSVTSVQTNDTTHMATVTATNASTVPDSFLVVYYKASSMSGTDGIPVGVIAHGQTSASVQCPDWSEEDAIAFGVKAVTGTYTTKTVNGITNYVMTNVWMESSEINWSSGDVPKAPRNVSVSPTSITGTVRVMWDWTWTEADGAQISWADHEDAWESTDEPEVYTITNIQPSQWNISGLETGVKWYVRVRLFKGEGDNITYGSWSALSSTSIIDLATAPSKPMLVLSAPVIAHDGSVTASWVYSSNDGTDQSYAEICQASYSGSTISYGRVIAHTETAQHVTINAEEIGWNTGSTYYLCVRVRSASGKLSDEWSDPVAVSVAEPLEAEITQTSLEEAEDSRADYDLTEMPLTITVTGAGTGGTTSVVIERAEEFHAGRPDENEFDGYDGESIASFTQYGESQITIRQEDLFGRLDDGALYKIIATVQDGFGQIDSAEIVFCVNWTHQAIEPLGKIRVDESIARITPIAPTGTISTDKCDIYRLSVDKPELIYSGAEYGTEYIDPYPTIGERGGYRLVMITANGDYTTADNGYAWTDIDAGVEYDGMIIDFEEGQLFLRYGVNISNEWSKGFTKTDYLGGSQTGDWTKAVTRTSTATAAIITLTNSDDIETMRRLAEYAGICHVRTAEGSSYAADVQVSETSNANKYGEITTYSLKITRVDPQGYDIMTAEDWFSIRGSRRY